MTAREHAETIFGVLTSSPNVQMGNPTMDIPLLEAQFARAIEEERQIIADLADAVEAYYEVREPMPDGVGYACEYKPFDALVRARSQ